MLCFHLRTLLHLVLFGMRCWQTKNLVTSDTFLLQNPGSLIYFFSLWREKTVCNFLREINIFKSMQGMSCLVLAVRVARVIFADITKSRHVPDVTVRDVRVCLCNFIKKFHVSPSCFLSTKCKHCANRRCEKCSKDLETCPQCEKKRCPYCELVCNMCSTKHCLACAPLEYLK